jgi:hypothetical protein
MNIELVVQDSVTGAARDISELAKDITWSTELSGQPGKLEFSYVPAPNVLINEGSVVRLRVNSTGVFFGYVFTRKKSTNGNIEIVAYDQMRYLKNNNTYIFRDMTASGIFEKICQDFQLQHRVVSASTYVLSDRVYDNKTLFDIIDWGITETMAYTANWYIIRDNFGTLEFVNLNNLKTNLFIGDASLLTGYEYESSIDSDTYNQIKMVKLVKSTSGGEDRVTKFESYYVKDSSTIARWGLLQYFETVDEEANDAQIQEKADKMLQLKNRVTQTLKTDCIGDLRVFAGAGVVFGTNELQEYGLSDPQYFVVTSCTHKFSNNDHTMSLDLKVSV